jgi:hypothetical protein
MTSVMAEFTVQPFADVPIDGDASDLLNAVGAALDADPRALGPVVAYDYDCGRIDAIFQVQDEPAVGLDSALASVGASDIFDAALEQAGLAVRTSGVSVVEGADPDLLP